MLDFASREVRKKFIQEKCSNLYTGTNVEGDDVIVLLQQGEGMDVMTRKKAKPKWYEVVEYDAEGYQVGVTYEPIEKAEDYFGPASKAYTK